MRRRARAAAAALLPWLLASCASRGLQDGVYARLVTNRGAVVIRLEHMRAPLTVANFVGLCDGSLLGSPFYDGAVFRRAAASRVEADALDGGPGWTIPDEVDPELRHDEGAVFMVTEGSHTASSRFAISLGSEPDLDGRYPVFGRVVRGLAVVEAIRDGDRIKSARILRIGREAGAYRVERDDFMELRAAKAREMLADHYDREESVVEEYRAKWPQAVETASGLLYEVLERGSGSAPEYGARVKVLLVGRLLDGTVFQSSVGETVELTIGAVVPGLDEALLDMRRGEKRRMLLPPDLGYGATGIPGLIPARSFLIFEIELVDFR